MPPKLPEIATEPEEQSYILRINKRFYEHNTSGWTVLKISLWAGIIVNIPPLLLPNVHLHLTVDHF
jgi:hypothetical protein